MSFDIHDECGIFGVILQKPSPNIIQFLYNGLFCLQHRGQEAAGIAFQNKQNLDIYKKNGLVANRLFQIANENILSTTGIGHVRYSTTEAGKNLNIQPIKVKCNKGEIAIAHNGNIPNAQNIIAELIQSGSIFQTTSDSEIFLQLLARIPGNDFNKAIIAVLNQISGAYSLLLQHENRIIAVRDPNGFKPLSIGEVENGFVFASETCAFDMLGAKFVRDVKPGELVVCDGKTIESTIYSISKNLSQCIFELIYFARPDSIVFGESVHNVRLKLGEKLAQLHHKNCDIVFPVPDSGNSSALGYSKASGLPFEYGLIRNHYIGRTFINPKQNHRESAVKMKLNPNKITLEGKKGLLIDDSIVRGTTSKSLVRLLRNVNMKEIHLCFSSPEIKNPCYFGIDTPTREELISANHTPEQIADMINADSVNFLSIDGLKSCVKKPDNYCYGCFSGNYPLCID